MCLVESESVKGSSNRGLLNPDSLQDAKQESLKAAKQQLERERFLVSDGPVVTFKWRNVPGWPLVYISQNVSAVLGYNRADLLSGRIPHDRFIDKADYPRVAAVLSEHSKSGATGFRHEPYRLIKEDGSVIWVANHTSIIRDSRGRATHFQGYFVDITERHVLEAQLKQAQKLESLGLLTCGAAHDFNNFVTVILGNVELLEASVPSDSPIQPGLRAIALAAENAADLAQQMLTFAEGKETLQSQIQLDQIISEMVQLLRVSIPKPIQLDLELSSPPPAVLGDAGQLRQVLMNLIINASDAIGNAPGSIILRVGAMHADRAFLQESSLGDDLPVGLYSFFEIEDTGCGMAEGARSKIFDPFYTTKMEGRGLGMATVLSIVRSHRGAIKVVSELGRGSRFRILLRAAAESRMPPVPQN